MSQDSVQKQYFAIISGIRLSREKSPSHVLFCVFFTGGQFWPSGIVIACIFLYVYIRVCVCLPWASPCENSSLVQARTAKFEQKMQHTWLRSLLI